MGYKVAVVGATGTVGREILKTLAERNFPVDAATALSTGRAGGQEVSFGEDEVLRVKSLEGFDFGDTDIAFFSAGSAAAAAHAPRAAQAGCIVIDDSPRFRMEPDVPLIVPEVNAAALKGMRRRRMVASPDAGSILLSVVLKPLHAVGRVKRVVATLCHPASGVGKEGMDELWTQTRGVYVNEAPPAEQFPKQIAFNLIPQVGDFQDDGATATEAVLPFEMRKLLAPEVAVSATCLRVPVFIGLSAAVSVEFDRPIDDRAATAAWREAPSVTVLDRREEGGYASPAEIAGEDVVYVSRLRRDLSVPHGLSFWCVTDNLRKGSALNAVQIAEELVAQKLLDS
jgi:aspartate-semialdehyde dehydrogenase